MMTQLALRLQKHLEFGNLPIATRMGAVVTLVQVTDAAGEPVASAPPRDVVIPANESGVAKQVPVEPGRWLIEATLPSGEIITEQVKVDAGQTVPLTLRAAERSPQEWLGWQHLLGNIDGRKTLEVLQQRAREAAELLAREALRQAADPRLRARLAKLTAEAAGAVWHACAALAELVARLFASRDDRLRAERTSASLDPRMTLPAAAANEATPLVIALPQPEVPVVGPAAMDAASTAADWTAIRSLAPGGPARNAAMMASSLATWVYDFERPVPPPPPSEPAPPVELQPRGFVHVASGSERYAVSLPLPWVALESRQAVPAQIMVHWHPLEQRVQIGVAVMDQDFGPLAGFMTASTLPKAAVAVQQAYDLLFEKTRNPLAAAAGGYILIAAGDPTRRNWHEWIDNLERWFPSLPDGAVLKGALLLRTAQDQAAYDQAREAFLQAYDRGIPYFSLGVSWLLDGLTLFAGPVDEQEELTAGQRDEQERLRREVQEKLAKVQWVAKRLDLSQAFTVIRLSDRKKPQTQTAIAAQAAAAKGDVMPMTSPTPTTFSAVNLDPDASAKLLLSDFVNKLLEQLQKVKDERHAYYERLRKDNSRWANGSRTALAMLGALAFLLTAVAAGLSFAPTQWGLTGGERIALLVVLAVYAIMGTLTFYEKGTDRTAAYFRHLSIILSIRDLWTKLQFELLKELTALNSSADPKAGETAARERIHALGEAFCNDLNKISTVELAEWRTDFMTSLTELAQAAQKGTEDATKQIQEVLKAADKVAADAKAAVAAKTAAEKAATEAEAAAIKAAAAGNKPD